MIKRYVLTNGSLWLDLDTKEEIKLSYVESNILFSFLLKAWVQVNMKDLEIREFVLENDRLELLFEKDVNWLYTVGNSLLKWIKFYYSKEELDLLNSLLKRLNVSEYVVLSVK